MTYWKSFENVEVKDVHRLAGTFEIGLPDVPEHLFLYVWETDHDPPYYATLSHIPYKNGVAVEILGGYWYTVERTASEYIKNVKRQLAELPKGSTLSWQSVDHPVHA